MYVDTCSLPPSSLIASARDPIALRRSDRAFGVATWSLCALARLPVGGDSCPVQPALLALLCILPSCASRVLLRAATRPHPHNKETLRVPCGRAGPRIACHLDSGDRLVCRHVQPAPSSLIASAQDPLALRRRGRAFGVATWLLLALARLPVGGDSCPVQPALLALLCILQCCASRALLRAAARPCLHSPETLCAPCGRAGPRIACDLDSGDRVVCRHVQPAPLFSDRLRAGSHRAPPSWPCIWRRYLVASRIGTTACGWRLVSGPTCAARFALHPAVLREPRSAPRSYTTSPTQPGDSVCAVRPRGTPHRVRPRLWGPRCMSTCAARPPLL